MLTDYKGHPHDIIFEGGKIIINNIKTTTNKEENVFTFFRPPGLFFTSQLRIENE